MQFPTSVEQLLLKLAAPALAALLAYSGCLWRFDHIPYDLLMRWNAVESHEDIVVIAIDEQSLRSIGRWPWPRGIHAKLIRQLDDAGARTIAFDILFAASNPDDPEGDQALVDAVAFHGQVVLPIGVDQTQVGGHPVEVLPFPDLAAAAAGFGHVDVAQDPDGVVRSHFLKAGIGEARWPSLPLSIHQVNGEHDRLDLSGEIANGTVSPILWQRNHRILVPFAHPNALQTLSYAEILANEIDRSVFAERDVLVGVTANGLASQILTPATISSAPITGIVYNAGILNALKRGLIIERATPAISAIFCAAATILTIFLYPLVSFRWSLGIAFLGLGCVVSASIVVQETFGLWIRPGGALIAILVSYLLWIWIELRGNLRYQRLLSSAHERALVTLHSVGDAVITTDAMGDILDMNASAEDLIGISIEEAQGRAASSLITILSGHEQKAIPLPHVKDMNSDGLMRLPEPSILVDRYGRKAFIRATLAPIRDHKGLAMGAVIAIADITETRRLSEQMSYLATHDPLTGLPNRTLLDDRLGRAIAKALRQGSLVGVLFVDLDQFKVINDGLGHNAGDLLLKEVAKRLSQALRTSDTVARFGGDEFIIVLEEIQTSDVIEAIIGKIFGQFESIFQIGSESLHVSCSIGAVLFPRDGETPAELLNRADAAMYRAKQLGRANAQIYQPGMADAARDQLVWSQRLQRAIRQNELVLYFQPQVDIIAGRVTGAEALVRWEHPELGLLMPDSFVPVAESTNLIRALDEWVIRKAHAQLRVWRSAGITDMRIAVNLSPRKLADPDVGQMIADMTTGFSADASRIELEITERTILHDLERTVANLRQLKAIGVTFAIDDFGTGYSSLSHLTALPVDRLKIDRSFIRSVPYDPQNTAIASAIIAMGKSLGLAIVAEGVETPAQVEFLRRMGCNEAQGFLICKPMPIATLTPILERAERLLV